MDPGAICCHVRGDGLGWEIWGLGATMRKVSLEWEDKAPRVHIFENFHKSILSRMIQRNPHNAKKIPVDYYGEGFGR